MVFQVDKRKCALNYFLSGLYNRYNFRSAQFRLKAKPMQVPYSILGLDDGASKADIERAYQSLSERLSAGSFPQRAEAQVKKCLAAIQNAYKSLSEKKTITHESGSSAPDENVQPQKTHPRLGQICVASGMISMEQLCEAVEAQMETGLPLGEILENKQFISRVELEGLLLGQGLIDVETDTRDLIAKRLMAMNLASADMIQVAQMELKWTNGTIVDVFVRHGWLDEKLAEILFES